MSQKRFYILLKRWVIERTNAWIRCNRRLARNYERLAASSEAFFYTTMIHLVSAAWPEYSSSQTVS